METIYGAGTDPVPYIAAAYLLGAVVFLGFFVWVLIERKRLRMMLATIKRNTRS